MISFSPTYTFSISNSLLGTLAAAKRAILFLAAILVLILSLFLWMYDLRLFLIAIWAAFWFSDLLKKPLPILAWGTNWPFWSYLNLSNYLLTILCGLNTFPIASCIISVFALRLGSLMADSYVSLAVLIKDYSLLPALAIPSVALFLAIWATCSG